MTDMRMEHFPTPNPVNLRVELWVGQAEIFAVDTDETTVELTPMYGDSAAEELIARARVEQRGDDVFVLMPKAKSGFFGRKGGVEARIRVPLGSRLRAETGSADLDSHGRLGDTTVQSGSGDIHLEEIAEGEIRTGSGDLIIDVAEGRIDTKCGSGDVMLGVLSSDADVTAGSGDVVVNQIEGTLKVKTGSGDIMIKTAGDGVDAMAGSGDLTVRHVSRGRLKAKTGSGDISISVADGTAAYLDVMTVTGDVTSSLSSTEAPQDGDKTVELIIQAGTGDVVLQRA